LFFSLFFLVSCQSCKLISLNENQCKGGFVRKYFGFGLIGPHAKVHESCLACSLYKALVMVQIVTSDNTFLTSKCCGGGVVLVIL
jgi:hypothetical protein